MAVVFGCTISFIHSATISSLNYYCKHYESPNMIWIFFLSDIKNLTNQMGFKNP